MVAPLTVPTGDADALLSWFADQLARLMDPSAFWLALRAEDGRVPDEPPPWYTEACVAGHCWHWPLAGGDELILALAAPPHADTRLLFDPLLALLADQLARCMEGRTPSCCQTLPLHQRMLDAIGSSVIGMDLSGFITSWNRGAEQMFGYTKDEALGRHVLFLYADEDEDNSLFSEVFDSGNSQEMLVQRKRRDGSVFWASIHLSLLSDEQGEPEGLLGYLTDATERVRAEEKLRLQSAIFEYSKEAIMVTDTQGRVVANNRALTQLFHCDSDTLAGQDLRFLYYRQYDASFWAKVRSETERQDHWIGEILCGRTDGSSFPAWLSLSAVRNIEGQLTHYVAMLTDVSERQQAKEKIYQLAHFDTLTGLPNRSMLQILLGQALEEIKRADSHGALLLLNIDRFKRINDALGVSAGDEVLVQLAKRLRAALRREDVVARCGPDEFVIALFDIARREHAGIVAKKVLGLLSDPVTLNLPQGRKEILNVTASIGITVFPDDGADPKTLLRHASIALSRLRQMTIDEERHLFFSSDMNARARERHQLEEDLRCALERRELMLHVQPQFDLKTNTMPAAEVLLRWQHHTLGMISPAKFIPVAEETGLIQELGDWVLETACATLRAWIDRGLEPVRLAVNLSARQFRPKLYLRIVELLDRYALPARLLELEITESLLMNDEAEVTQLLNELRGLGLLIALDDFGTGYSALSYLRRLSIDTLKIDRSFIRDLPGSEQESALVISILNLARNHGLEVVAEGVETQEQLDFLRQQGCSLIQGFLLARPMPLDRFEALLPATAPADLPGRSSCTDPPG